MKVVAFNGSPKVNGNTAFAIQTVADALRAEDIEVEIVHVGNKPVRGCVACGSCARNRDEKCVFNDDIVNECIQKAKEADGIIISSPVYFSGVNGTMKSFLDRLFYVSHTNERLFRHKVGASVVAVRRSGGVATFDELNHYLFISEMLLPGSNYWSVIHGQKPVQASEDTEGVECLKVLGQNMAWLLKMKENTTVKPPEKSEKIYTNFIR